MPLNECMQKHTHRQYLAWMEWLDRQWDNPTRSDHYLMQIAREIAMSRIDPSKVGEKRLSFTKSKQDVLIEKPKTREEAAAMSKARWGAFVGVSLESSHVKRS